jgi:hypothetical protein
MTGSHFMFPHSFLLYSFMESGKESDEASGVMWIAALFHLGLPEALVYWNN